MSRPQGPTLSAREHQVAAYVAIGHSNKLIAYELGLSPSTIAVLVMRASRKMGVRSRAELARAFRRDSSDETGNAPIEPSSAAGEG